MKNFSRQSVIVNQAEKEESENIGKDTFSTIIPDALPPLKSSMQTIDDNNSLKGPYQNHIEDNEKSS